MPFSSSTARMLLTFWSLSACTILLHLQCLQDTLPLVQNVAGKIMSLHVLGSPSSSTPDLLSLLPQGFAVQLWPRHPERSPAAGSVPTSHPTPVHGTSILPFSLLIFACNWSKAAKVCKPICCSSSKCTLSWWLSPESTPGCYVPSPAHPLLSLFHVFLAWSVAPCGLLHTVPERKHCQQNAWPK